ncbi:MAG: peptidyl-prolyl cis-trans isomerase [Actinomycetota bacterium]
MMIFLLSCTRSRRLSRLMWSMVLVFGCAAAVRAQETPAKPGIVASVNGKTLTELDFLRRCEQFVGGGADTAVGFLVLKEWIQQTLAEEEAGKRKLLPTERQVDVRVKALRKQFELSGQEFTEWLTSRGRTLTSLQEEVRQQIIAENLLTEGIEISEFEVQLYYENNKQILGEPERIQASRITVDEKKAAQEVDAALKRGDSFEELARKRSIDPYKDGGGKIPAPVNVDPRAKGPLEPEVLQKALRLDPGKSVGPIKQGDYWVFVRLDQRLPAQVPALSDVKELLRANLKVQKGGPDRLKEAQGRLDQLVREAKVEIHRPQYQGLVALLRKGK